MDGNKSSSQNQHYVPKLLLRNFTVPSSEQITTYDKWDKRTFTTNIKNIASETGFYNYKKENIEYSIESSLSTLETSSSPIIKKILENESPNCLQNKEKTLLSYFIIVQILRTKHARNNIIKIHKTFNAFFNQHGIDPTKLDGYEQVSENYLKKVSINQLKIGHEFIPHLLEKNWVLLKTPDETSFFISDHPVVMDNQIERPGRGNLGLAVSGIEIYLPLSPVFCLALLCSSWKQKINDGIKKYDELAKKLGPIFKDKFDMSEIYKIREDINTGGPTNLKEENVVHINSLQVLYSARFVFSRFDNFTLIDEMLNDNPDLAQGITIESNISLDGEKGG